MPNQPPTSVEPTGGTRPPARRPHRFLSPRRLPGAARRRAHRPRPAIHAASRPPRSQPLRQSPRRSTPLRPRNRSLQSLPPLPGPGRALLPPRRQGIDVSPSRAPVPVRRPGNPRPPASRNLGHRRARCPAFPTAHPHPSARRNPRFRRQPGPAPLVKFLYAVLSWFSLGFLLVFLLLFSALPPRPPRLSGNFRSLCDLSLLFASSPRFLRVSASPASNGPPPLACREFPRPKNIDISRCVCSAVNGPPRTRLRPPTHRD